MSIRWVSWKVNFEKTLVSSFSANCAAYFSNVTIIGIILHYVIFESHCLVSLFILPYLIWHMLSLIPFFGFWNSNWQFYVELIPKHFVKYRNFTWFAGVEILRAICQKLCWNCAFPQNFHSRNLGEITVFLRSDGRKM